MGSLFRFVLASALVASLIESAEAQDERCTRDALTIDSSAVSAKFCIPAGAGPPSVNVTATFSAQTRSFSQTVALPVVAGAAVSRTIDDVDLAPLGLKRSLHMTLAYREGTVVLEHALALPGATPVK